MCELGFFIALRTGLPRPAALWSVSRRPSAVADGPMHTAVRSPHPTHLVFDRDIFSSKLRCSLQAESMATICHESSFMRAQELHIYQSNPIIAIETALDCQRDE